MSTNEMQCLRCKGANLITGDIGATGNSGWRTAVFKPDRKVRFLAWILGEGTRCAGEAFACLDCGLVWSSLSAKDLSDFITKNCEKATALPAPSINSHDNQSADSPGKPLKEKSTAKTSQSMIKSCKKICVNCGLENDDEEVCCCACGGTKFTTTNASPAEME